MIRFIYEILEYNIGLPNSMEDHCEESMTFADTYEIQNETECSHDDVNSYQASPTTLYCTVEGKNNPTEIPSQLHLVSCQTCYWCATFLNINKTPIFKCEYCNSIKLDSIPVSDNEMCKFRYDPARGVTMEFSMRENTARPMYMVTNGCGLYV
jgi:hypothetical protein